MYTCPEKEIHSIYLDGELQKEFALEYESHIASCEKCRKELDRMRVLHEVLAKDSVSMNLSEDFMEESYKKLQSRMHFKKVVEMSAPKKHVVPIIRTFVPMAAAAAAVFAIMIPLKMNSTTNVSDPAANLPIISKAKDLTPIADSDVFIEGGIEEVAFHPEAKQNSSAKPLELKVSNFEFLNQKESDDNEMTIRLTELKNLNPVSASNVSFNKIETLDFLK